MANAQLFSAELAICTRQNATRSYFVRSSNAVVTRSDVNIDGFVAQIKIEIVDDKTKTRDNRELSQVA